MTGIERSPEEIQAILSEILQRPQFFGLEPSWWDRFLLWAGGWAQWLEGGLRHFYGGVSAWMAGQSMWLLGALGGVAILTFAAFIWYVLRLIRRTWVGDARLSPLAARLQVAGKGLETELSPRALRKRAKRAAHTGNTREAVRFLHQAALAHLQAQGVLHLTPHATNREYLQAARSLSASRHASFSKLTSLFERVWYGEQRASESDIDYGIRCVTALLE